MSAVGPLDPFAAGLTELMAAKGLSLYEVSARSGLNRAVVGDILLGKSFPRRDVFRSLRQIVGQGDIREEQYLESLYVRARNDLAASRRQNSAVGPRSHSSQWSALAFPAPRQDRRTKAPAPDPILYSTAVEFIEGLNEVYIWALKPSLRELERLSELNGKRRPRSTLSNMLNSTTLPKWDLAADFLELNGVKDTETWNFVWRRIKAAERANRKVG